MTATVDDGACPPNHGPPVLKKLLGAIHTVITLHLSNLTGSNCYASIERLLNVSHGWFDQIKCRDNTVMLASKNSCNPNLTLFKLVMHHCTLKEYLHLLGQGGEGC
jgi:hypothetical protein